MTPQELLKACQTPVEMLDGRSEMPAHIYLTVRKKTLPMGRKVRLAGRAGPRGTILNTKGTPGDFRVTAVFQRKDVIAFVQTHTGRI